MVQSLLDVLQIGDDFRLDFLRQLHVLHRGIRRVNLPLELSRLLVEIRNDQSHITENIGVNDSTQADGDCHECDLECASRDNIIACQEEHGMIHRDPILVVERAIIQVEFFKITVVKWGDPDFVRVGDKVPQAGQTMEVHDNLEHELKKFHG